MKWTLLGLTGLVGGWSVYTVTMTPGSADYGKASVAAVVTRSFRLTRSDTLRTVFTLEGTNPADFRVVGAAGGETGDTLYDCPNDPQGRGVTSCDVEVDFRPTAVGVKTATLVATDAHGQKATAALRGEGVVPACKFELVACNWTSSYMGTITIHSVDSTINSDTNARSETTLDVMIDQGKVTCKGTWKKYEQVIIDNKATDEESFVGSITGPGLAAIEFLPDSKGKMSYRLTYACASAEGRRENKSLQFNTSQVEDVKAEKPDWRDAILVGELQPAPDGPGMSPIVGRSLVTTWNPEIKQGTYVKASWMLRTP